MDDSLPSRWIELRELPGHPEMSVFPDRDPKIQNRYAPDVGEDLKCPKCHYLLTGIGAEYCPVCGIELSYEPITVFSAADQSLVWAAAMVLDQNEISNLMTSGSYDPILGIFTSRQSLPHIMVPFKFYHEAVQLLDTQFGQRLFKGGEKPSKLPEGPDWACSSCEEENPVSFEVCWNCGLQRPDAPVSNQ
ncbi:MAG: hypothetical protein R3E58_18045 [Phycisphaerae bacterium]